MEVFQSFLSIIFFNLLNLSSLNYSLFINMKWGILDIVAGYDVLYSQPCKSSSFASRTSVTAAISSTFFRRRVCLLVSGILHLCLCSLPFLLMGLQMAFQVTKFSTIFWKSTVLKSQRFCIWYILASFFDKAALMLPLDLIH